MADALYVIPASVLRNLSDKLYEKRKNAALEVEGVVRRLAAAGDHDKITAVINLLTTEFTNSSQANHRKGGLIGLAAATVGLSSEAAQHLEQIVPPVLSSFSDQDSRVKLLCLQLYIILQRLSGDFIVFFNRIFDALCRLTADSDANVQSAAHLLDRLVKDIVTESDQFRIYTIVEERMNVLNPYVRQFLVGWITVLDSVPDIDMLADSALSEFLQEIKNSPSVDYGRMAEILVQRAASPDEFTRLTAITWINEFVKLGGDQLIPYYADILGAILPSISDKEEKIRAVTDPADGFAVGAILSIARRQLSSEWDATRIEALNWISTLLNRHRAEAQAVTLQLWQGASPATLLRCEGEVDDSKMVVLLVLEVHACIAKDPHHFRQLLVFLMHNFGRGALIIRRLCVLLDAERVYKGTALNLILLTSSELSELRDLLKQSLVNPAGKNLFVSLYSSWCHSPMAIISLCLLAQEDINVKFLVQLDKLIHLLENSDFAYLRLQEHLSYSLFLTASRTWKIYLVIKSLVWSSDAASPECAQWNKLFFKLQQFEQMQQQHRIAQKHRAQSRHTSTSSLKVPVIPNDIFGIKKALSDPSDEVCKSLFLGSSSDPTTLAGDATSNTAEGTKALNLILLTSSELSELRDLLKQSLVNPAGKNLFAFFVFFMVPFTYGNYKSLLISAGKAYPHASSIIQSLVEEDINVKFLVQLDKLIHLLETPIFAYLRLQEHLSYSLFLTASRTWKIYLVVKSLVWSSDAASPAAASDTQKAQAQSRHTSTSSTKEVPRPEQPRRPSTMADMIKPPSRSPRGPGQLQL
ncbi:hypothetical protein LOK49_LG03G01018 [Camellia lanceoleosa]|uniref:Uncharacterized protein n=1 Tax=Camellia lanceoleosa TaxID=1840588 RepID=A0ACC0IC17_9ERIC|nr:hypothetical protein LOK49_LG03G01018 [Camellia lanceoleosa]